MRGSTQAHGLRLERPYPSVDDTRVSMDWRAERLFAGCGRFRENMHLIYDF